MSIVVMPATAAPTSSVKAVRAATPSPTPKPRTIFINYHGTDTFTFSSMPGDKVKTVDRYGHKHTYKTLAAAIQAFFADKQHLPATIALWMDCQSITLSEARHLVLRLKNEGVEGFQDMKASDVALLPKRF